MGRARSDTIGLHMTTVGEAVRAIGIVADDGDIIIVRPSARGMNHFRLPEVEDKILEEDCYFATGTYGPGTVSRHSGRIAANLLRINELPFDFDLADSTGIPKDELWQYSDAALWPLIEALREEVETAFGAIGLTLHRIDYTGYGLAGYLRLPLHKPEAIPAIQELHARIVKRINTIARVKLCDPQVVDAGTRIMRLPGCLNTKGAIPRRTRTLVQREGMVNEAALTIAAGATSTMAARIVPVKGAVLDEATVNQLIDAVQPHWNLGQKHNLALALSGLLAKAGVPEEQTLAIVQVLSAGDEKPWDREKCVHTSYEKVRAGQKVKGFYGLQDTLPVELVSWLDNLAQRVYQASKPRLTAHGESARKIAEEDKEENYAAQFPDIPELCYYGLFGSYRDVMGPSSEAPDNFHLGCALTLVGAMVGRRVRIEYASDALFSNLYTVLIGASGSSRKDTAMKRATNLPYGSDGSRVLVPAFQIQRDVSSAEGLVSILKDSPNTLLYLSELSIVQKNAARKGTATIFDKMIEAWDSPPALQNLNKMSPQTAPNPHLSILAATQPKRLADQMTADDMHSGFANRWLYIIGAGKRPMARPPAVDRVIAWSIYKDWFDAIHRYPEGHVMKMHPDGDDRWDAWYYKNAATMGRDEDEDAMRIRHATIAQKLALIYAVSEGAQAIHDKHLEPAIALVEWMWGVVRELMKGWGVGLELQIELAIQRCLAREQPLHRSTLQKRTKNRKWSGRDFSNVFEAMVRNGHLDVDPLGYVAWREYA